MAFLRLLAVFSLATQIVALPFQNDISLLDARTDLIPGGLKLDFTVSRRVPRANTNRLGKRSSIVAGVTNHDSFYTVQLAIGSQQSVITVDLDTGSSDLWVPTPLGNFTEDCTRFGSYDPADSTTSQIQNQSFLIQYEDNSTSSGEFYLDQVSISGVEVPDVIFASVNVSSVEVGILGVSYEGTEAMLLSGYLYKNFPEKLVLNGLISKNYYSLYLNSPNATQGSIIFGGIDETKYTGPLVTLENPAKVFQLVFIQNVTAGNITTDANYIVILDSGTTFTYLNKPEVDAIVSNFPGAYLNDAGYYAVDCNNVPTGSVTYTFKGIDIDVPLSSLVGRQFDPKGNPVPGCILDVGTTGLQSGVTFAILGDNFLRYAYVVYDLTDQLILLAKSVPT